MASAKPTQVHGSQEHGLPAPTASRRGPWNAKNNFGILVDDSYCAAAKPKASQNWAKGTSCGTNMVCKSSGNCTTSNKHK